MPQRIMHMGNTVLSAINVSRSLLRLISVTVFKFTHPPVLSALLILSVSVSGFLIIDFPLLIPSPFLSSAHLHGTTFPSLRQNPCLDSFKSNLKTCLFPKQYTCQVSSHWCYLFPPQVPVYNNNNKQIYEQMLFAYVSTLIPPRLSDPCSFITVPLVTREPEQTTLLF